MPLKMALSVQIKHLNTSLAHGLQTNQCSVESGKITSYHVRLKVTFVLA